MENGGRCVGRFKFRTVERAWEKNLPTLRCDECLHEHPVATLYAGVSPAVDTTEAKMDKLVALSTEIHRKVENLPELQAESAGLMTALLHALASESRECPRLFDLNLMRSQLASDTYRLRLWCEHPSHEQPWKAAEWEFDRPKEWLSEIAGLARVLVKPLKIAAAAAGFGAGDEAVTTLSSMEKLVSTVPPAESGYDKVLDVLPRGRHLADGGDLRVLHSLLLDLDRSRDWGDLQRFPTQTGDFLWICPEHAHVYDPGLPTIPTPNVA